MLEVLYSSKQMLHGTYSAGRLWETLEWQNWHGVYQCLIVLCHLVQLHRERLIRCSLPKSYCMLFVGSSDKLNPTENRIQPLSWIIPSKCLDHWHEKDAASFFSDAYLRSSDSGGWCCKLGFYQTCLRAYSSAIIPPFFIQPVGIPVSKVADEESSKEVCSP